MVENSSSARRATAWLGAVLAASALSGVAPSALAAQNILVPMNSPAQGGVIRGIQMPDANTLLAAVLDAGVYKSTDGGATWSASNSGLSDVRTIALTRASAANIYLVATLGGGLFKSIDTGATWSASNGSGTGALGCAFIRSVTTSSDGSVIFASGCGNIYRSGDGGASWTLLNSPTSGLPVGETEVSAFRIGSASGVADSNTVWAATLGNGIYRTTDGLTGANWVSANGSPGRELGGSSPPNGLQVYNVVGRTGSSGALYAYVEGAGVFASPDGGGNWDPINTGLPATDALAGLGSFVRIGETNGRLYIGIDGHGMYRTGAGGVWELVASVASLPGPRFVFNAVDADTFFAATLAGVYKSTNGGTTWTKLSNGLPGGVVKSVDVHPSAPNVIYAAADFAYKSTDGGTTWSRLAGPGQVPYILGDVARVDVASTDPTGNTVLVGTRNQGLFISSNGGASFTSFNTGIPGPFAGADSVVVLWPGTTTPVAWLSNYGRGAFVHNGSSWVPIANGPLSGAAIRMVRPITDGGLVALYASTGKGLYKSLDGGTNWFSINPNGLEFSTNRLDTDPADPNKLFVSVFLTDILNRALPMSGVYASHDAGQTWQQAGSGEKAYTLYVAGSGPTAKLVVGSWGFGGIARSETIVRCSMAPSGAPFGEIDCQEPRVADAAPSAGDWGNIPGMKVQSLGIVGGVLRYVLTRGHGLFRYQYSTLGQDFDGNGSADIFWRNANGQNYVWNMDGLAVEDHGSASTVSGSAWQIAGIGDFNGDGHTDNFWRNTSTGENVIWLMNNRQILQAGAQSTVSDQGWKIVGAADFDGDGKSDLLWRHDTTGANLLWLMNGRSRTAAPSLSAVPDANWKVRGVGDFNRDGRADILWRNVSTGQNAIWFMNGATRTGIATLSTVAPPWDIAGVGDFNGDGKHDILWKHATTGQTVNWLMDGGTRIGAGTLAASVSSAWNITGIGDYNGDGNSDVMWRDSTTGENFVWFVNGTASFGNCGGALGCSQNGYLPSVSPASGWSPVFK